MENGELWDLMVNKKITEPFKILTLITVGDEIPSELVNPVRDFSYVGNDLGVKVLDKYVIFKAELPSLGYNIYHLEKINNVNTKHQTEINNLNQMAGYDVSSFSNRKIRPAITIFSFLLTEQLCRTR